MLSYESVKRTQHLNMDASWHNLDSMHRMTNVNCALWEVVKDGKGTQTNLLEVEELVSGERPRQGL